jgi:hypothetical protein
MQGVSPEEALAILVKSWEAVSADSVRKGVDNSVKQK